MREGWTTKPLGDVCDVIGGGTPPKDRPELYGGDIPWATVRDMRSDLISNTEFKITLAAVKSSATNIIPKNNVVIATRVGLGKVCLVHQDTAINQDLRAIIPKKKTELFVPFLFWWLKSVAHLIVAQGTGATVQGVKLPFIKSLAVPLPTLSEQQRIVAILDQAVSGLTTATSNVEKNLKNVRELFDSYLNSVFMKRREGWSEKPLSDLIVVTHGYAFDGQYFVDDDDTHPILLTPGNFSEVGSLIFNERNTKQFTGDVPSGFALYEGDLVVVMTDLSSKMKILGKPAFVDRDGILHNQRIGRVIFKGEGLLPSFLYYFFRTADFIASIKESATGTMVKHTAPKRILSSIISFPSSVGEQKHIASNLDVLATEVEKLEMLYRAKALDLTKLRQSILQRAFSGELSTPPSQTIKEAAE